MKEEHLRQLAQKARDERAGIKTATANTSGLGNEEEKEREMLRQDRHKERARERNLARAAPDKRYFILSNFIKKNKFNN